MNRFLDGGSAAAPTTAGRPYLPEVAQTDVTDPDDLVLWQVLGQCDFEFGTGAFTVRAGQGLWVPAGLRHSFRMHAGGALLPMALDGALHIPPFRRPTVFHVDAELQALLYAHMQQVTSRIQRDADIGPQVLRALTRQRVLPATLPMPTEGPAAVVAEALRADPSDDRSVGDLAEAAHASVRTIERAFLAQTGQTLREWRTRNRMDAAAEMLRRRVSPEAVAHRVGYASVSAFRRAFKTHHGMTPSAFTQRFGRAS